MFISPLMSQAELRGLKVLPPHGAWAPEASAQATGWITWSRKTACFSLCILILFTVDIDIDKLMPSEDDLGGNSVSLHSAMDD